MECPNIDLCMQCTHVYSLCIACNDILASTQAEVASRDDKIRQLEESCKQLVAQVSTALDIVRVYICIVCIQWELILCVKRSQPT